MRSCVSLAIENLLSVMPLCDPSHTTTAKKEEVLTPPLPHFVKAKRLRDSLSRRIRPSCAPILPIHTPIPCPPSSHTLACHLCRFLPTSYPVGPRCAGIERMFCTSKTPCNRKAVASCTHGEWEIECITQGCWKWSLSLPRRFIQGQFEREDYAVDIERSE